MDPVSIAFGLSRLVPGLVRWLGGDRAGDVARKAVDVALEVTEHRNPKEAVIALQQNPELQLKLQEAMTPVIIAEYEAETRRLETVNATMRAEAASNDPYVRRWRPTLGYVVSLSWGAQMSGLTYAIVALPDSAPAILGAMGSLTAIWGVALSILGISVAKRSQDKQVAAGQAIPRGLFQSLTERLIKNKRR